MKLIKDFTAETRRLRRETRRNLCETLRILCVSAVKKPNRQFELNSKKIYLADLTLIRPKSVNKGFNFATVIS